MNMTILVYPTWYLWSQQTLYAYMHHSGKKYLYFPDSRSNISSNHNFEHIIRHQNEQELFSDFLICPFINNIWTQTQFDNGNLFLRCLSSTCLMPDFLTKPRTLPWLFFITQYSPPLLFHHVAYLLTLPMLPSSIPYATFDICFLCYVLPHILALPTFSSTNWASHHSSYHHSYLDIPLLFM